MSERIAATQPRLAEGFNAKKKRLAELSVTAKEYQNVDDHVRVARIMSQPADPVQVDRLQETGEVLKANLRFVADCLADPALVSDALAVLDELMVTVLLATRVAERIADHASDLRSHVEHYPGDTLVTLRLMHEAYTELSDEKSTRQNRSAMKIRHAMNGAGSALEIYFSNANLPTSENVRYRTELLLNFLALSNEQNVDWIRSAIARHIALAVANGQYSGSTSLFEIESPTIKKSFDQVPISMMTRMDVERWIRPLPQVHSRTIMNEILKYFKLPHDTFLELDEDSESNGPLYRYCLDRVIEQLECIRALEAIERGATANMHKRFGIRWFSRYPINTLIYQYKESENMEPYGVFFAASHDWSQGMFEENDVRIVETLDRQLRANGSAVRIVECAGKAEMEARFRNLSETYGEHTAQFFFLRAHSSREGLSLGAGDGDGALYAKDLAGDQMAPVRQLLAPKGTIVFDGFAIGRRGGFAQIASKVFDTKVIAPHGNQSALTNISVVRKEGSVDFEAAYDVHDNLKAVPPHIYV